MRIIIACSGAGGHLSAGLSIAEAFRDRVRDIEIFFLSSDYRKARGLVTRAGFGFYRVYAKGLVDKNLRGLIRFTIGQLLCLAQSGWLLALVRPGLVVGTGGFSSTGIILWSRLFGIPVVLHEQNLIPGRANRLLAPLADKVLVSFRDSMRYFKSASCRVTGMPVRFKDRLNKEEARIELGLETGLFTILVMGGSSGARRINRLIVEATERLSGYRDRVQFIHLTGAADYGFVKQAYIRYGFKAYVEDFSSRMSIIYSASDLVISRSGSGSVSEIAFFGLPAVFIPYPYTGDRHQLRNARAMAEKGAAVVIPEDKVSGDKLIGVVTGLMNQPERLRSMGRKSQSLAMPDAARAAVEEIVALYKYCL